jgi:hypothetical protein
MERNGRQGEHIRVPGEIVSATPPDASPSWRVRLLSALDESDASATALAKGLTAPQLNWNPGPGVWSIGQCIDHLCVANDVYLPAMSAALARRPHAVVNEIIPGWFGRWFIRKYIDPSPGTRRARAPRKITPRAAVDPYILDRFLATNQEVREFIVRASHHDVNRIRFSNPFVPLLRFTVGTGLEILTTHQRRHLLQAERVRALTQFPA